MVSHCCVTHRLAPRSRPVVIRRFKKKEEQQEEEKNRTKKKEHSNCNLETNKAEPSRAVCAPLGSAHLENMLFFVVTLAKCYKPLSGHFVWATIWEQ